MHTGYGYMANNQPLTALGLMSGTSLDGIDAAVIVSDGVQLIEACAVGSFPYDPAFREDLRACLGKFVDEPGVADIAGELTCRHVQAVKQVLQENNMKASDIDLVGFHGHTILHCPQGRLTVQIGDPATLAKEIGIRVIGDFRSNDVAEGGEGAPFAPLFHHALCGALEKPLAVLNVGGVANVTWIGEGGTLEEPNILAFDTGPGNALIDDWVSTTTGRSMDEGGRLAHAGTVQEETLDGFLANAYFGRTPPKSLDRDDFAWAMQAVAGLTVEDGAATLSAFSVLSIGKAREHFPEAVKRWLVTGGGRHNDTIMAMLDLHLGGGVDPIEAINCNGDALEAQAFAFLAIRSLYGMPLSLPKTTRVPRPMGGGTLFKA
jgi:anhydro-N-acetylmuramic acid kinase